MDLTITLLHEQIMDGVIAFGGFHNFPSYIPIVGLHGL